MKPFKIKGTGLVGSINPDGRVRITATDGSFREYNIGEQPAEMHPSIIGEIESQYTKSVNKEFRNSDRPPLGNKKSLATDPLENIISTGLNTISSRESVSGTGVKDETTGFINDEKRSIFSKAKDLAKNPILGLTTLLVGTTAAAVYAAMRKDGKTITDEIKDGMTNNAAFSGTIEGGTTNPYNPQENGKLSLSDLEKAYGVGGHVSTPEAYRNAASEYVKNFKISDSEAEQKYKDTYTETINRRDQMYNNAVNAFYDQILQGFGRSNGEKAHQLLQENSKLKNDVASLMENSAKLALSMTMKKNPTEAMKLRAEASREIMNIVSPGTWDKIADNALKASAGIVQVAMFNAEAAAKKSDSIFKAAYGEGSGGSKGQGEYFNLLADLMGKKISGYPTNPNDPEAGAKFTANASRVLYEFVGMMTGKIQEMPQQSAKQSSKEVNTTHANRTHN